MPWPKLFQNLRSTRETELTKQFPIHVVCKWLGNSTTIASKHYLQITEEHYQDAAGKAHQNAHHQAHQNAHQRPSALVRTATSDPGGSGSNVTGEGNLCNGAQNKANQRVGTGSLSLDPKGTTGTVGGTGLD